MAVTIDAASVDQLLAESELFTQHWEEVALHKDVMQLDPAADRYRALQDADQLLLLQCWDWDTDAVVGYSVNVLSNHMHYQSLYYCQNDLLYLHPDYRRTYLGRALIQRTEEDAKAAGAKLMLWHAKTGTALEKVLPRFGYGVQDVIFSKEL